MAESAAGAREMQTVSKTPATALFTIGMAQNLCEFCYHEPDMCLTGIDVPLLNFRVRMRVSTEFGNPAADLPCSFHKRIEQFVVGPHKAWIVCNVNEYHFYVEHGSGRTYIYGTYWTTFFQAYDIQPNDLVRFDYDDEFHMFDVQITNANNEVKSWVQDPECRPILPSCEMTLQKSLFEFPCEVSGSEMNAISWAFYKKNMMDLENGEHIIVPQFFVHRVQDQEEINELDIPLKCIHGYILPRDGRSRICMKTGGANELLGSYHIDEEEEPYYFKFTEGWSEFAIQSRMK